MRPKLSWDYGAIARDTGTDRHSSPELRGSASGEHAIDTSGSAVESEEQPSSVRACEKHEPEVSDQLPAEGDEPASSVEHASSGDPARDEATEDTGKVAEPEAEAPAVDPDMAAAASAEDMAGDDEDIGFDAAERPTYPENPLSLHEEAFFSTGDEGTYDGGPATLPPPVVVDEHELAGRPVIVRSPEQVARRARLMRTVSITVGAMAALFVVAVVRSSLNHPADPPAVVQPKPVAAEAVAAPVQPAPAAAPEAPVVVEKAEPAEPVAAEAAAQPAPGVAEAAPSPEAVAAKPARTKRGFLPSAPAFISTPAAQPLPPPPAEPAPAAAPQGPPPTAAFPVN